MFIRSLSKKPKRKATSPLQSLRSSSRSSGASESMFKQKGRRSSSRITSLSPSPEARKDDFEIRRNKNSVQKKRHYRNNRGSSASSLERDRDRDMSRRFTGDGRRRRGDPVGRRFSPHGRSPRNEAGGGSGRVQRSRSHRRSKSRNRSRSRIRSRSPIRRSRSPRRFNRRRSPMMHFRGRGGNNRGRMNHWRRSLSRGRGGNGIGANSGGGRFDRRFSPQRRFSREKDRERDRRSSPIQHQFRKFSPSRRYSPQPSMYQPRRSRERRMSPNQRDRRPSSPMEYSRDRGGGAPLARWDQSNRPLQRMKRKSTSESSNWEENEDEPEPVVRRRSVSEETSPVNNNGRRERSMSSSLDRRNRQTSPLIGTSEIISGPSVRRSSIECTNVPVKTVEASKESRSENIKSRAESKEKDITQNLKQLVTVATKRIEKSRDKYSSSLSRTPSPFLKPHEKEKAHSLLVGATAKKSLEKKVHQDSKESDSSSSDSSAESDESDDDEEYDAVEMAVVNTNKKLEPHSKSEKRKSSASEDKSAEESLEEKKKMKACLKETAKDESTNAISSSAKAIRRELSATDDKRGERSATESHLVETNRGAGSVKKLKTVSDMIALKKVAARSDHKTYRSSDDSECSQDKSAEAKPKQSSSRKSGFKKQKLASSDSENELTSKNKRKKSKKSSRRFEDDSSSESEEELSLKKKKHKKHKKHSKKSKKHKKHKKKSKKADSSSSSDDGEDIREKPAKITSAGLLTGGVNEDLEKQLRERALKSMKKIE